MVLFLDSGRIPVNQVGIVLPLIRDGSIKLHESIGTSIAKWIAIFLLYYTAWAISLQYLLPPLQVPEQGTFSDEKSRQKII
jgi:hypothetical protein